MLYQLKHNRNMNRLSNEQRTAVVSCLIEGCSIRSTVRMTGVCEKAVTAPHSAHTIRIAHSEI